MYVYIYIYRLLNNIIDHVKKNNNNNKKGKHLRRNKMSNIHYNNNNNAVNPRGKLSVFRDVKILHEKVGKIFAR